MSLLVDTNVCIGWLKGDARIRKRWLACKPGDLQLCSVVKAELLYGARKSSRVEENLQSLHQLFAVLPSLAFDDDGAAWYGLLRAQLEREGKLPGPNDLMIAATALANDLAIVTRNTREFQRVPGLRLEEW
ncbi:MAG: type II toxin-antitoxin system VapC family toxin [Myxococcaceae bacterium]